MAGSRDLHYRSGMHGTRIRKRPPPALLLSVATLAVLIASALGYYLLAGDHPTESIYTTASEVSSPDAISPIEITVIDGDTIRARGKTIRLVGFDAPETGSHARCPRERELGDRATTQLKTLIAGGGLELRSFLAPVRWALRERPTAISVAPVARCAHTDETSVD